MEIKMLQIFSLLICLKFSLLEHKKIEGLFPGIYDGDIYTGYLETDQKGNELFYVFTPSQNNPDKDPVMLWLNGGPGCSSLFGWLAEVGPVITELYSNKWTLNKFAWNKNVSIIFLEQPAGVGFSKTYDEKQFWNESLTASGNLEALKNFFYKEFPSFNKLDFYIAGESYAGVFIPNLIEHIVNDTDKTRKINLKGALIGNGLIDFDTDGEPSAVEFAFGHAIMSLETYQAFLRHCNHSDPEIVGDWPVRNATHTCNEIRKKIQENYSGLDIYGIYRPCKMWNENEKNNDKTHGISYKQRIDRLMNEVSKKQRNKSKIFSWEDADEEEEPVLLSWCKDDYFVDDFLNDPETRKKLGITTQKETWTQCQSNLNYPSNDSIDFFLNKFMLLPDGLRIWFFSGDLDGRIPTLGSMRWLNKMINKTHLKTISKFRQWKVGKQVAGFIENYEKDFAFLTVTGAGHMVPQDKREEAYTMLMGFLKGEL